MVRRESATDRVRFSGGLKRMCLYVHKEEESLTALLTDLLLTVLKDNSKISTSIND